MTGFAIGLVVGVIAAGVVAAVVGWVRSHRSRATTGPTSSLTADSLTADSLTADSLTADSLMADSLTAPLDLRAIATAAGSDAEPGLQLWWNARPIMTIERFGDRELPPSHPVPGAFATVATRLLDDPRVRRIVASDRYALVKVPRTLSGHEWVRALDGRTPPLPRDPDPGRFAPLPTLVGGARTGASMGASAAAAPVLAAVVAATWAHQQLESTMTAMRAGMERISLRLDDADHGVIAAAQARIGRLGDDPAAWTASDLAEMAAHRTALERVYQTAQRRADRRFDALAGGERFPTLDADELDEIQRDLVLLVDATLARGQMELVRAVAMLDAGPTGLLEVVDVEDDLRDELSRLATRLDGALDIGEPGWHRPGARRRAVRAKTEVGRTLAGLEDLLDDLGDRADAELLLGEVDGQLDIRSIDHRPSGVTER